MAALIRCLGNFTKTFHATITHLKSTSTKASTQEAKFQNLVDKFKKTSDDQKFRRNKTNYTHTIRRLAKTKQFAMIEDVIEHQKSYDDIRSEGFAVRLICLYGESGMFAHARKLFDEMPSLNCSRTVKSLNALLKAGVEAGEFERVVEAFKDLPSEASIQPDIISHNTVIHALCETGSLDEALSTFRQLAEPDIVTFNTLFNALYKSGRVSEGESLWAAMGSEGGNVAPNARSYNARLRGLFSAGEPGEAVRLAGEMISKGIEPDGFTYNALITGFCGNGDLEEAKKCYDELRRRKFKPRLASTYLALIPACCEAGDLDKAFELCSEAVEHRLYLNSALFELVIGGLTVKGRTKEASELKKLMNHDE